MVNSDNFRKYPSNTFAGTLNNFILRDKFDKKTARIFYRVSVEGCFNYRFCFSNVVDSTYEDGSRCVCNTAGGEWQLHSLSAGACLLDDFCGNLDLKPVTFNGKTEKHILSGESFWSDEINLNISQGSYLCLELTFSGSDIPYTPDKTVPAFSFLNGAFVPDKDFPQPILIGCKRDVKQRVAFLGDSITQGLGTENDKYEYWVAEIGRGFGEEYSVWNLGLGCGRAYDASSNDAWLSKAKTADTVFVCFGVNDILNGRTASEVCQDIEAIVTLLRQAGCRVGILSVPPFDLTDDNAISWYGVNEFIRCNLAEKCDYYFNTADVLGLDCPNSHLSRFGSHPNGEGGYRLGQAFCRKINL